MGQSSGSSSRWRATPRWPLQPLLLVSLLCIAPAASLAADQPGLAESAADCTPAGTSCDDGDPCTKDTVCQPDGSCAGGSYIDCDDQNSCTQDSCEPGKGCAHLVTNGASCDDQDACTAQTVCSSDGKCGGGTTLTCDDHNSCTVDACDAKKGCTFTSKLGEACDDRNACTKGDACDKDGFCSGQPVDCDDRNPCTDDSCHLTAGCLHTPSERLEGLSCETENPCVRNPVCSKQGLCTGEARADGTPCELAGGCLAGGACQGGECTQLTTQADGTACEDGYLCTRGERCLAGACTGGQPQAGCDGGRVPIDAGLTTPPPLPWCTCRVGSPNRASPLGTMLEFWLLCVGTWLLRGRRHRGSDRHGRAVGDCPRT